MLFKLSNQIKLKSNSITATSLYTITELSYLYLIMFPLSSVIMHKGQDQVLKGTANKHSQNFLRSLLLKHFLTKIQLIIACHHSSVQAFIWLHDLFMQSLFQQHLIEMKPTSGVVVCIVLRWKRSLIRADRRRTSERWGSQVNPLQTRLTLNPMTSHITNCTSRIPITGRTTIKQLLLLLLPLLRCL